MPQRVENYTTITSDKQLKQYKRDFNELCAEYKGVHSEVKKNFSIFEKLQLRLLQTTKGTEEYKAVGDEIKARYHLQVADPSYVQTEERFKELHSILKHMKNLMLEYNQNHLNAAELVLDLQQMDLKE